MNAGPKGPAYTAAKQFRDRVGRVLWTRRSRRGRHDVIESVPRQIVKAPRCRSHEFIVGCHCYKPGSYRVVDDVLRILACVGLVSQDPFEITLLPQAIAIARPVCEACALLAQFREATQIRLLVETSHQKVHVVRHYAVRKERKLFVVRSTLKLRERLCRRSRG